MGLLSYKENPQLVNAIMQMKSQGEISFGDSLTFQPKLKISTWKAACPSKSPHTPLQKN